ncbi:AbrB/MazE/SpoVT family DNA-binding domain-containing protein [Halobacterium salinarum]|uniref:AbrB/MazE/SpoVT family DNA-binding domain-containing protein n=1 Tax=Halobacterium salinarum TaxID=2242 RepID=UPI0025526170|nr:AbrB/MazE/SpoVT family DNA-binding domain-containing protein [Halobacterium salinarum]MDL0126608.1 AbrB/MazE/SpoVT family DNA-binding domain-containing protein [Halobacterium salinarum]
MSERPTRLLVGSRTLIESGNSTMVTIPPDVLDAMDVAGGGEVEMVFDREADVVEIRAEAPESEQV